MNLTEYQVVSLEKFMGLYSRGLSDQTPTDHAQDCLNLIFDPGEVSGREGSSATLTLGHSVTTRITLATFDDTTLILLTLDGSGNIYKDTNGTPILTVAGMTDYVSLNMFNKCFISPINGYNGTGNLKVWDGTNAVRNAAGLAPVQGSPLVVADGAAGSIDIGIHKFAVIYETSTGFRTPPGPKIAGVFTSTSYNAPGAKKANISGIPTGPTGTVKRTIIATKANEEEFFFVPNGTINDNTATTLTVDFFDSDLVISADYLFDLLETIPAGCGLAKYHGRLIVWGGEGDLIRVSLPGDPESFSNVDGFIQLPAERDGNTVRGSCQLRDVLYFTKFPGIYGTEDNGQVPSAWNVILIDGGAGSFYYGISTITGSQPTLAANDLFVIGDRDGLYIFDGVIRRPALTWKIQNIWNRLTKGSENKISNYIDPFSRRIYCFLPVDGSTTPNYLLVGDYSEGISSDTIKWTPWTFPLTLRSIAMTALAQDGRYALRLGNTTSVLYSLDPTQTDDFGTAISTFWHHALVPILKGNVNFYIALRLRAKGTGNLTINLYNEDSTITSAPPVLALATSPGKELLRLINFTAEKMAVKFTGRFTIDRVDIFGTPRWPSRPA